MITNSVSAVFHLVIAFQPVYTNHYLLISVYCLDAFFSSCWSTLVDSVAVIDGGADYGRMRLWAGMYCMYVFCIFFIFPSVLLLCTFIQQTTVTNNNKKQTTTNTNNKQQTKQ